MPDKKPTSIVDSSYSCVQGKLLDVMGPPGKLWAKLERVACKGTQKSFGGEISFANWADKCPPEL